jgi:hypothetical protein
VILTLILNAERAMRSTGTHAVLSLALVPGEAAHASR